MQPSAYHFKNINYEQIIQNIPHIDLEWMQLANIVM